MIKWIYNNKVLLLVGIAISISIPMFIMAYEMIILGKESVTFYFNSTIGILVILYYVLLILFGLAFFIYWLVQQIKVIQGLKNEKTKAELSHLKAQVSPHFFFNMLNNLYGWIDKDSEKAKELVLKLSDMMRYSIYDGQKDTVTIAEEITFLKNYIELHKVRYHKNIDVDFSIDAKNEEVLVMPLLFFMLLENAFKHGVETLRADAFVHLSLVVSEKEINFEIKNNFEENDETTKGIGLKNLKRRLVLMYPNSHELITKSEDNIFIAQLRITNL